MFNKTYSSSRVTPLCHDAAARVQSHYKTSLILFLIITTVMGHHLWLQKKSQTKTVWWTLYELVWHTLKKGNKSSIKIQSMITESLPLGCYCCSCVIDIDYCRGLMEYESGNVQIFLTISKCHSRTCFLIYSWFGDKAWRCHPLSLNSERLSINECLSTVKEVQAADECSFGITASPWDRREITICIKHWRETGDALIKTKLA